jgi:hypothetical protein
MDRARHSWSLSALFERVRVAHADFNRQDVNALV